MPLNFPSSPTDGQTYTQNNTTWIYSANTTAWRVDPPVLPSGGAGSLDIELDNVNATRYLVFANNTTGNLSSANVDTLLTYNPSTGNVSIGRTSAGYKLDIVGTVNASAVLVNGAPLTAQGGASLQSRSITIPFPTSSENIAILFTSSSLNVSRLTHAVTGSAANINFNVSWGPTRNIGTGNIVYSITSNTLIGISVSSASLSNTNILANNWLLLKTTTTNYSSTTEELHLTLEF